MGNFGNPLFSIKRCSAQASMHNVISNYINGSHLTMYIGTTSDGTEPSDKNSNIVMVGWECTHLSCAALKSLISSPASGANAIIHSTKSGFPILPSFLPEGQSRQIRDPSVTGGQRMSLRAKRSNLGAFGIAFPRNAGSQSSK